MSLQRRKNFLILWLLVAFAVIVFGVTIVKTREYGADAVRPLAEQKAHQEPETR